MLAPSPIPSATPAATARTFLTAPPRETPATSSFRIGAKAGTVEKPGEPPGAVEIGARDGHRGRKPRCHLAGRRSAPTPPRPSPRCRGRPPPPRAATGPTRGRCPWSPRSPPRRPARRPPPARARPGTRGSAPRPGPRRRSPPPPPAPPRRAGGGERSDRGGSAGFRDPDPAVRPSPHCGSTGRPGTRCGRGAGRARSPTLRRREPRSPVRRSRGAGRKTRTNGGHRRDPGQSAGSRASACCRR